MKPAAFEYERPTTIEAALELLADGTRETFVLAGGQSLMPMLAMRLSRPERIVDINEIAELQRIEATDGVLEIGACTRQRAVEHSDVVRRELPVLVDGLHLIGHPTIRNRGTFGGSLAHADPAAELPALAVALGAELLVRSPGRTRTVPAEEFLVGLFTTSIVPGELVVAVRFAPSAVPRHAAIVEYSRRSGDFAIAGAVCAVDIHAGVVSGARVVGVGVDPAPRRCAAAEDVLNGADLADLAVIDAAAAALAADCNPTNDVHGSAAYRRRVVAETFRRAVRACLLAAQHDGEQR